jgi:hypothetical protein
VVIDPNGFQPLPLAGQHDEAATVLAEAEEKARQIVATAEADAEHLRGEAQALRTRTLSEATSQARSIREEAKAEQEQRQRRDDNLDTWAARAIIAGTVGLTASGEYALARMVGFDQSVAWLLPFVIDVYVIQAFRRHRDIVQAISLTVAANVTYHLADKGLFGVEAVKDRHEPQWWLIAMVASVASLILWRVHLMTAPPKPARERQKDRRRAHPEAPTVGPERAHSERTDARTATPTESSTERAQNPRSERPVERTAKPKGERRERTQKPSKKSAPKTLTDRRIERVRALYTELGKRPEWTEIRDALVAEKLADKAISRSSCQRIRDRIEEKEPTLAALGSDNVRAIPGN